MFFRKNKKKKADKKEEIFADVYASPVINKTEEKNEGDQYFSPAGDMLPYPTNFEGQKTNRK